MKKLNLYFIRHCESIANANGIMQGQKDYELSQKGILQAQALKNKLQDIFFDKIFTSPLTRSKQTAEIINKKSKIINLDELKEMDIGIFSGLNKEQAIQNYENYYNLYKSQGFDVLPNAESKESLNLRCLKIMDLIDSLNEENYLFVSHGIFLSKLLPLLTNSGESINLDNGQIFFLSKIKS